MSNFCVQKVSDDGNQCPGEASSPRIYICFSLSVFQHAGIGENGVPVSMQVVDRMCVLFWAAQCQYLRLQHQYGGHVPEELHCGVCYGGICLFVVCRLLFVVCRLVICCDMIAFEICRSSRLL